MVKIVDRAAQVIWAAKPPSTLAPAAIETLQKVGDRLA